ncbi:MAG TPA: hypothetical protein VKU37_02945 [Verrucomicrobiae bacterium]|nr:hypothetical protein [Verrucomicrobiae bacterium]
MHTRRIRFILFAAVLSLAGFRATLSADGAPPASAQTVARIHWLGMKHLAGDTNAAHLMAIWNLPESGKLERQTLDKLSLAPWPLLHRNPDTNAAALLRPLLDDLVENESCLEIDQTSNQPDELVFAIRLDDQRAALWQTNLARVLESLTGIHPVPAPERHYGWSLKKHHDPDFLELTRAGQWTIFGAAQEHNALLGDLLARIRQGQSPLPAGTTDNWLEADLNPVRLVSCLATLNPASAGEGDSTPWRGEVERSRLNHFHLAVKGDGTNVLTSGQADFAGPLLSDLEPWNIPTNLIDESLCSFTIARGIKPWLESLPAWNNLQIGPPPDQICFWAMPGPGMMSYFAAPLPDASNAVDRLAGLVLQNQHRWVVTNDLAKFGRSTTFNGLEWKGLPYMAPFLKSVSDNHQNFVFGGGIPGTITGPLSLEPLQATLSLTNLVYRDWEMTGSRTEQWLYISQFARFVFHRAQLPVDSPAALWLKAIPHKLGDSVTDISRTGPDQLTFTRQSSIGFTGFELNLLADWLQSPQFPRGLHTFRAPPDPLP